MNKTKEKSIRIQWLISFFFFSMYLLIATYFQHIHTPKEAIAGVLASLIGSSLLYYFAYIKRGTLLLLFIITAGFVNFLIATPSLFLAIFKLFNPTVTYNLPILDAFKIPAIAIPIYIFFIITSYRLFCLNFDYRQKTKGRRK